ncbi:MAG: putative hydrolase of the superfamily [Actinomycetota bacterium]|nr:putative hydrolase of the superfamily [Actinomycetota bacterium]
MIRAVTFDFWDTLVSEEAGAMRGMQLDAWADVFVGAGIEVPADVLAAAFRENWLVFEQRWVDNEGQWTPHDATDFICDHLGMESSDLRDELVETFARVGERAPLVAARDAVETLTTLRGAGIGLGIVCDVGLTGSPTLRQRLEGFGLLEFFDAWAFSDETGWFKPAADAFAPALEGLGIEDPAHAAHIGDSKRTDIAGALALGMTAIRFAGFYDRADGEGPEASSVITHLAEIPGILGI